MDFPLFAIVANLVLQRLKKEVVLSISCSLTFYFKYVDDLVMAVPSSATILIFFNTFLLEFNLSNENRWR